ncbi:hypothetical protein EC174750_5477 [Escherichia coli 174750]|nr:hypothetical protein EC174750_5477 [Escherichia coli 174750]
MRLQYISDPKIHPTIAPTKNTTETEKVRHSETTISTGLAG